MAIRFEAKKYNRYIHVHVSPDIGAESAKQNFQKIKQGKKKSFEPDSNQRPMDIFTTTVHRSTN